MMNSCLFQYTRNSTDSKGAKAININYLNPYNVISFYWENNEQDQRRLFVFLPGKSLIFGETLGKNLVIHMENWLRLSLPPQTTPVQTVQTQVRRNRPAMDAEVLDSDILESDNVAAFVS